ncbi:MAG TPA: phenylacetic acid degradation protein [Firmicutes bacterium]|nr:phenylacetic acid degradation protein [Bacillota bacterium]
MPLSETIKDFFARDKFCESIGVQLVEAEAGSAKTKLVIEARHLNGLGTVQGGAIFTLADLAIAAAANSRGNVAVVINANISYVKAVSEGVLYAEAVEDSLHSKLGTYTVKITNEMGERIATLQGMVYRKKDSIN